MRLGAATAGAFDLSAGCSGFIYGLSMAANAMRSGAADHVLVVGAETLSRITDWTDRNTCVLFGDGAGAVVVSVVRRALRRAGGRAGQRWLRRPIVDRCRQAAAGTRPAMRL